MLVKLSDGRCSNCDGQLKIIDADDATMTVECQNPLCGESYLVEPDAFGDGFMEYYVTVMSELEAMEREE